jgi:hypothetical protein
MNFLEKLSELANDLGDARRARICRDLLAALHERGKLDVELLYDLPYDDFQTAIEAMKEWRLQRYWDGDGPAAAARHGGDRAQMAQRPA